MQARAQDDRFEGVRLWRASFCSARLASCSARKESFHSRAEDTITFSK